MANRILTVGDSARAKRVSKWLDGDESDYFHASSWRGFPLYTGRYKGVPVTIIASGMGYPNIDFVVRESRAVVRGEIAIVRFGSSGGMRDTPPGAMCVATDGCVSITRNPDAFASDADGSETAYMYSKVIPGDAALTELLAKHMALQVPSELIYNGVNASACSFYASQGRIDANFDDRNEAVLDDLEKRCPTVVCCEMETSHMFDLARCSKGSIRAGGLAMVLANRKSKDVVDADRIAELEEIGGRVALDALVELPVADVMSGPECVWEH